MIVMRLFVLSLISLHSVHCRTILLLAVCNMNCIQQMNEYNEIFMN